MPEWANDDSPPVSQPVSQPPPQLQSMRRVAFPGPPDKDKAKDKEAAKDRTADPGSSKSFGAATAPSVNDINIDALLSSMPSPTTAFGLGGIRNLASMEALSLPFSQVWMDAPPPPHILCNL